MAPTLVVFDIGGVLVRIRRDWDEILSAVGDGPLARTGVGPHASYEPLVRYQQGEIDEDAYLMTLGGDLGVTPEQARAAHVAILEGDYVGARGLVEELNAAGVGTACLSNTNALHWVALTDARRHPAVAALGRRIASFEIRFNKPNAEAYLAVRERYPEVERFVFFDDSLDNVLAASRFGWEAHRIDPDGDPPAQMRRILAETGVL